MHVKESIEVVIDANKTPEAICLKATVGIAFSGITEIIGKTGLAVASISNISEGTCAVRANHLAIGTVDATELLGDFTKVIGN